MNENFSRRLMPSSGALHCFELAVRYESFSRAAEEVGLTQGAVSRQIASLEDWLQVSLFERNGRRVRATPAGHAYAEAIAPALARIRRATASVMERRDQNDLTIATLPSFGMRWLAPRLPQFSTRHPEVIVNFTARSAPFDLEATGYDGAIHFGLPDWPRARHVLLFQEIVVPVISPNLVRDAKIERPIDLLSVPLLSQQSRRNAWSRWFETAGVDVLRAPAGPVYEHFLMLAQAAVAGAGAALMPAFLIEPELASGALVVPFDTNMTSAEAYYFVRPEGPATSAIGAFEAWISEAALQPNELIVGVEKTEIKTKCI